jgi:signal transduction histidine kinase
MPVTIARPARSVVGRGGDPRLLRADGSPSRLLLAEEARFVCADEDGARPGVYGGHVRSRPLIWIAVALAAAGLAEALLAPGAQDARLVSALAAPLLAAPLAWSHRAPVTALAAVAGVLAAQAALGGGLAGRSATTIAVLAVALFCAGRFAAAALPPTGAGRFAAAALPLTGAAGLAAAIAVTRIAADPAARAPRDALLTFAAVACPLLVGRWVRGQTLLQRELAERSARRERMRERDARHAAEEERTRIAADLRLAVAGGLREIVDEAGALRAALERGPAPGAGERLAAIAATARTALADVRRVLGVLRHEGDARRLAPPAATVHAPAAAGVPEPSGSSGAAGVPEPSGSSGAAGVPEPSGSSGAAGVPEPSGSSGAAGVSPPSGGPAALRAGPPPALVGAASQRPAPALVDAALAAAVALAVAVELALTESLAAALTALPVALPLLARRRAPLAAAAGVLAAIALQSALVSPGSFPLGDMLAMVAASYAVGAHAERRRAVGGVLALAAGVAAHAAVVYPDGVIAALLGGVGLPWTVGRVVRGSRALTREGRRRSAEIEHGRAQEARAAVARERAGFARELHDAVAHNVSVIAIQAGGAVPLADRDPARAAQILELIEQVAREAVAELGRLGAAEPGGSGASGPDGGRPGLAQIGLLADRARATGLDVEVDLDGAGEALPAGVDLAAFRVVQEALANTAKHARAGHAWVRVRCDARAVDLEIADDGGGPSGARRPTDRTSGHGLLGMRERVALYGGTLHTGPRERGRGFLVRARIPVGR